MTPRRFANLSKTYPKLRIAVVGDYSLDRYLEIDPSLNERSIETGRIVHNVTRVRSQPGSAGTIVNNLSALGIGQIFPIGFCGRDGEGFELADALKKTPNVEACGFFSSTHRRTFTYCKPLLVRPGRAPKELNRLDSKNWTPTPRNVERKIISRLRAFAANVDAIIVMDQVEIPESGTITDDVRDVLGEIASTKGGPIVIADSRRGLGEYPPLIFKMNLEEFRQLTALPRSSRLDTVRRHAQTLAARNGQPVFVTMADKGILGAAPRGETSIEKALPVRGEIDVVGAGDAVTANLAAAMATGASLPESIAIANAAAHLVIHQLGTTGTASVSELSELIKG